MSTRSQADGKLAAVAPPGSPGSAVIPMVLLLEELRGVVESLTDEQFTQKPVGHVTSSFGSHLRHSLDHIRALLTGWVDGRIDYDHRARGTDIESDRGAAIEAIDFLCGGLMNLPADAVDAPVSVSVMMSVNEPPLRTLSTVARELGFVLSHTLHHNALLAVMLKTLGVIPPARFGYAPSTLAHHGMISAA